MPRSGLEVVGKTFSTDMVIAAHAMREKHYAILVLKLKVSYVSNPQDKHNASFMSIKQITTAHAGRVPSLMGQI